MEDYNITTTLHRCNEETTTHRGYPIGASEGPISYRKACQSERGPVDVNDVQIVWFRSKGNLTPKTGGGISVGTYRASALVG